MKINPLSPVASKINEIRRIKQLADITSGTKSRQLLYQNSSGDKVLISEKGRRLLQADPAIKNMLDEIPDVRNDKIELAAKRIREGHYLKYSVVEKIAESIISRKPHIDVAESE